MQRLWVKCLQILACSVVIQNEADIKNWCCAFWATSIRKLEMYIIFLFWRMWIVPRNRDNTLPRKFFAALLFPFLLFWRFPEIPVRHWAWMVVNDLHGQFFFDAGQVFSIQFWECKIFTLVDTRFLNKHKLEGNLKYLIFQN